MGNIVAIVGRPNVGKSTLFNRLIGDRKAIMHDESGVTRDRHYGSAEWTGKHFTVIDTGGYVPESSDVFEEAIREQVSLAVEEADVIIFMTDVQDGLTDMDKDFANIVRRSKKPIILAVNKVDHHKRSLETGEFYALGLGDPFSVSSQNGLGTGELLDELVKHLKEPEKEEVAEERVPRIAILGRPNAGKSSLLNALLNTSRSIVTDIAGTTRDSIDTHYTAFGKNLILTDTAGIRKKSKVQENIEFYSVLRAIRALESSDVCLIIIDAERGLEAQDMSIIGLAQRNGKGMVILVNKWDLIEKDHKTAAAYEKAIHAKIAPLTYIPVLFISVLNKQRIFQALEKAEEVFENRKKRIPTSVLNEKLLEDISVYPPPAYKGKYIRIKYVTQLKGSMPIFAFFCNLPQYIREPYARFLENKIRLHFGFEGVPIKNFFRKK